MLTGGIVNDGVGIATSLDSFADFECFQVEDTDGAVAAIRGKSKNLFRCQRHAMNAISIGNVAKYRALLKIEDLDDI